MERTLLAKNVLQGKTKGYKNHPQLIRFKNSQDPIKSIDFYLSLIYLESLKRNFNFNKTKFKTTDFKEKIIINKEQIKFEFNHLQKKLKERNFEKYLENKTLFSKNNKIESNNLFNIIAGPIEHWEKI